jgi:hypothetical protein
VASICIGVPLIVVAFLLARRSKALLIDESPDIVDPIRAALRRPPWVVDVIELVEQGLRPGLARSTGAAAPPPLLATRHATGEGRVG